MSTYSVPVVRIKLEPHPNADSLSIVKVGGFQVCARTEDWTDGQLAAYVEPDYVVPADRPEFAWLAPMSTLIENNGIKGYRVKVKRLRGVLSMGLMIPAPEGAKEGDNVIGKLGIVRYEVPIDLTTGGEACKPPPGIRYCYDVEGAYNFKHLFTDGEEVVATEKVHGASGRFCAVNGEMHCGSRTEWKRKDDKNLWWRALEGDDELRDFCLANQDITVYGEVYGQVGGFTYGVKKGEAKFVVFDLLRNGNWIDHDEGRALAHMLYWVPVLYRGPWHEKDIFELAAGKSVVAKWYSQDQIREGIVVKPIKERTNIEIGRTQVKIINPAYWEKS